MECRCCVLVFLALFVFSFFRDPERVIPAEAGRWCHRAMDAYGVTDENARPGREAREHFLAVWNVHVIDQPAAEDYEAGLPAGKIPGAMMNGLRWRTSKTCLRFRPRREKSCSRDAEIDCAAGSLVEKHR